MVFFKSISHCLTVLFGASLLLASCTLTTEQETKLNADMNLLIKVRNEGDALSYLNLTHPLIVKHYKEKSDAVFKSKFQEMPRQKDQDKDKAELIYWKGGYIKSIASNDSLIHAKIQFTLMQNHQDLDSSSIYYGINKKQSSNWTFVSAADYFTVLPKEMRLFE